MIKSTKQLAKFFLTIFLGSLISANLLIPTTVQALTSSQVCPWLNNQNGGSSTTSGTSSGTGTGTAPAATSPTTPAAGTKSDAAAQPTDELKGKIAVITEEALGNADGKFTFKCYRQTTCTVETKPAETPKPADAAAAAKTPAPAAASGATKEIKLRKCKPEYVEKCNGTESSKLAAAIGDPNQNYVTCEPVMIYISSAGTDLLYNYIGLVYRYMAGLGAMLTVLFLIAGGVMVASSGDSDQSKKGKEMITNTITGLVILFLSALILYTINPNFFVLS